MALCLPIALSRAAFVEDGERSDLHYPKRIVVPTDLDAVEVRYTDAHPNEQEVIFPAAIYYRGHYEGWQQFLLALTTAGIVAIDTDFKPPTLAVTEPHTFRGMEDGYNDCRRECRRLARIYSEAQLQELARKVHRPVTTGVPSRPKLPFKIEP